MKTISRYLVFAVLVVAVEQARSQSSNSYADDSYLKNQAEFHLNDNLDRSEKRGESFLGVGVSLLSTSLSVTEYVTEETRLWGEVGSYFGRELDLFLAGEKNDETLAYNSAQYTQDLRLALGGSFLYSIDEARTWFVHVGPYLAFEKGHYKIKSYKKLCTFICGYDPNSGVVKDYPSEALIVGLRFGVEKQTIIYNFKGELGLAIDYKLASTESTRYHNDLNGNRLPIENKEGHFIVESKLKF